ncbi:mitotic spindle assembly checkpoint protein MAD1 [Agrilus planipennis]|uniref:Mitotic spindle assembly checkpoint protein MAD1 n=1 Tax=Agrilus planipennis TaxID=224129 RepID=A0A1W4XDU7_AGRPL|nr:mitotic spindle assembly checkpoint protein MAD1 [Agrilus planipennis]
MSMEERNVNDTIIKMITNLNPKIKTEVGDFNYDNTAILKRRLSNVSSDEDSPVKKHKKIPTCSNNNSNASYLASPREARRLRADLIEARNTVKDLENRIQHMHSIRKEMQIMFDNETKSLKLQHEHDKKTIEELESQLQTVRKREASAKNEISNLKKKYELLRNESESAIIKLEKELNDIKLSSKYMEDEEQEKLIKLQTQNEELVVILEAAQQDAEAHKKLVTELEKQLLAKNEIERELEKKQQALLKVTLQLKDLEYVKDNYAEYQQLTKAQLYKLNGYSAMEKENQQLKEENKRIKDDIRNKLLLEEEVYDLRNRLNKYKDQEQTLASLQAAMVQNEVFLNEWKTLARSICESSWPDSALPSLLRTTVEKLQQKEINLTTEIVQLQSQLNAAIHEKVVAQSELEKNQKHLAEVGKSLQQRQNLIHRMQKKLLLISRERDSYRLQLDSYERDLTVCMIQPSTSSCSATSNPQQTQKNRIESLEKIIEGYRDMVAKLENELQTIEHDPTSDVTPVRMEQIERLLKEIDILKTNNAQLRGRCDQLEVQLEEICIGQDSNKGRIIHLKKNPLSESIEEKEKTIERLQEENDKLKRMIRKMEEGLEATKLADTTLTPQEVEAMREKVVASENKIQQLKDFFKQSMQEFRNVLYMLLGYKIDKLSNAQYKLTSMYAERPEDQICFQLNSEGNLNLLENHFSASLEDMIDLHLRHQKSIPVFLSALTIDLFNNRTTTTATVEID